MSNINGAVESSEGIEKSILHLNPKEEFYSELIVAGQSLDENIDEQSETYSTHDRSGEYVTEESGDSIDDSVGSFQGPIEYQSLVAVKIDTLYEKRPLKTFITGSTYVGEWSKVAMERSGTYTLPHGVVYKGGMKDGMFHGEGTLTYPLGQSLQGIYCKGKLVKWNFVNSDRKSNELTAYCKPPDRRYRTCIDTGLKAAPMESPTNKQPARIIPYGCYDVGDGFYNTYTEWVHMASDIKKLNYMPPKTYVPVNIEIYLPDGIELIKKIPFVPLFKPVSWIMDNCRKQWDELVGYKPQLYEYWYSGRKKEIEELNMTTVDKGGKFPKETSVNEQVLDFLAEVSLQFCEELI